MTFCFSVFWLGLKRKEKKKKEANQAYKFTKYSYGWVDLQPVD